MFYLHKYQKKVETMSQNQTENNPESPSECRKNVERYINIFLWAVIQYLHSIACDIIDLISRSKTTWQNLDLRPRDNLTQIGLAGQPAKPDKLPRLALVRYSRIRPVHQGKRPQQRTVPLKKPAPVFGVRNDNIERFLGFSESHWTN